MSQKRFMRRGVTKIFFLEEIAAANFVPTRAEITAGTDITQMVAGMEGFATESNEIETPDMGSRYTPKIPGDKTSADSSLTFYEDQETDDVEALFPDDTEGFVVIMRKGDVPTKKGMDIFAVRVRSTAPEYTTDAEAARITTGFSITNPPVLNQTIPAATP